MKKVLDSLLMAPFRKLSHADAVNLGEAHESQIHENTYSCVVSMRIRK